MINWLDRSLICKFETILCDVVMTSCISLTLLKIIVHDIDNLFFQRKFKLVKKFASNHCMNFVTLHVKIIKNYLCNIPTF
jgi:hypothetical protein